MPIIAWIGLVVFVLAIIGFIYGCRGSRARASDAYETRSVIEDSAGLGGGG